MADSNIHPEMEAQKRRSTRIVQAVPLTVTGVDALGRPFQERTSTLIINCHGARYQSKHYVLKNMWVTLEVPHNEPGRQARTVRGRVTWIQRPRTVRELFQIGLELEVSGNVWGIAFPPADWFPFPEGGAASSLGIAATPFADEQPSQEAEDWSKVDNPAVGALEAVEDNVRVIPLPASEDASLQIARQVARLVAEAKQQIQSTAQESASRAVAAETRPLLDTLQTQLREAAEQSVAAAAASQMEKLRQEAAQHIQREQEASMAAMLKQLSREMESRLGQARLEIDSQMEEIERTRRAEFDQQIQSQLQASIQKMESLSGSFGKNQDEVRAVMNQLRESAARAAADEMLHWKEQMDLRTSEAQARLTEMDQSAKKLSEQIAAATAIGEAGWRKLLEDDLVNASKHWQETMDSAMEAAKLLTEERLLRNAESSALQVEQQLQQRINLLGNAHSQVTAEAESALGNLRASISGESAKGEAVILRFQESVAQLEAKRGEFSAHLQSASEEWARRGAEMLEAQSAEMNRRAEAAVGGMGQRLQPMLEAVGHESIDKLAKEFEQRFAPQVAHATEILGNLAVDQDQAEKAIAEHQQRIWQVSDRGMQDMAARSKDLLAQIERDFAESARTSSSRWLTELEARATETSHSTFESLYKSAEWYEKKIQTQMQTTLEKGLDQAAARLREKAAEMSGLFASELDHYSRSYVEHAQGQMQENAREAGERGAKKLADAGDAAAAGFVERASQLGREQFEIYSSQTRTAMDANSLQVRANLESDARGFAEEFRRALAQHAQETMGLGKQELNLQIDKARDLLLSDTQNLEQQFHASLNSVGENAMDEHKQRLDNASNSWLLTTVSKLNQQSESLINEMSLSTEKKLKAVCSNVFSEMGETLRQRMAGLAAPFAAPVATASPSLPANSAEDKK